MSRPEHRALVERYFHDVHQNMDLEPMAKIFAADMVLNIPGGGRIEGRSALQTVLRDQVWTLLVPGSVRATVEFLPLGEADRARHPDEPDALVKFRARIEATRKQAHEEFGTKFSHEVTNVWRIEAGRCAETWPSFAEDTEDRDLIDDLS